MTVINSTAAVCYDQQDSGRQKHYVTKQSTAVRITTPTAVKTHILIHQAWEIFEIVTCIQHILNLVNLKLKL